MTKEELLELKAELSKIKEEKERNKYLRKIALGEISGPIVGYPEIDKPWLKYFTEEQLDIEPIEKTAYRYMYEENCKYQNDTAIIFMGKKIKYFELFNEIEKVAKALKQLGVKENEVVTICLPNTPESAYLFYACSKIGAIADFIDPRENEEGLEKYLDISKAKHLIMLDLCFDNFKNLIDKKEIKNVVVTSALETLPIPMNGLKVIESIKDKEKVKERKKIMKKSSANYLSYKEFISLGKKYNLHTEEKYKPNQPVAIVHTGGTTGVPKGVLLSNDNLNELTNQIKACDIQFIRHYLLMGVMPEFVGYGLSVGLHTSLVCGMETMMIPKYEPEKIPKLILKHKPNCLAGSPAHWEIFATSPLVNKKNVDLSFLKAPIEGGDTLNLKMEKKTNEILKEHGCEYKIQKGYGMTEKCSAVTVCFTNEVNKLGGVGAPFVNTNVMIYDNFNNTSLKYNEVGEICVNAPDVMLEYYNNKEETDKVIRKHDDGKYWLHSGDLGYIDEDGLLFIVDRLKDIIIRYNGQKIYPHNVENILLKHPNVKSVAVVGKSDPNHMNGEIVTAFITSDEPMTKEMFSEINDYAIKNLVDYSVPDEYKEIDTLPKTQVGKVDKKKLKESLNTEKVKVLKR